MKIVVFTSNSIRHKFVANSLTNAVDDSLIISECKNHDSILLKNKNNISPIEEHFLKRYQTEKIFFKDNDTFIGKVFPIMYKEVNLESIFNVVRDFQPDLMIVFGSSIIKDPLLSFLKPGQFVNLHLGLSPYYRGSGTNFWPFVNDELEFVGSTILHLDSGIDTGDIVTHVRPKITINDNVHSVGCKVIIDSVPALTKIIDLVKNGKNIPRTKQWSIEDPKYYKLSDFTEEILLKYKENMSNGLVENYLQREKKSVKLLSL